MCPQPSGKVRFRYLACGQPQKRRYVVLIRRRQGEAIQPKKQTCGDVGDTLVAVRERMVARDAVSVGGRKIKDIGVAIGVQIFRPRQR